MQNQKFYYIPFGQLIDALRLFADRYGLVLDDSVDDAYTSKTSCLSGDVLGAQNAKGVADLGSDVFQKRAPIKNTFLMGPRRRVKRGLFEDALSGLHIHADINAAVNILRVYFGDKRKLDRRGLCFRKLSHPRLIRKDALLRLLDQPSVDSCLGGELAPWSPRFQVDAQSYS